MGEAFGTHNALRRKLQRGISSSRTHKLCCQTPPLSDILTIKLELLSLWRWEASWRLCGFWLPASPSLLSPQHHSNMPFPTLISPDFHPPPFFTCHATLITKLNSSVVMIKIKVEEKYTTCPCQNSWQVVEPDSSIEEDRSSTGGVELFLLFPLLHLAGLYFQMYYP